MPPGGPPRASVHHRPHGHRHPDGAATIRFSTALDGEARLELIDIAGSTTRRLVDGYLPGGTHELAIAPGTLPARSYLCRLTSGDRSVTTRIIVLR